MISAPAASASRNARLDLPLAVGPAISQMRGSMQLALTLVSPQPGAAADALPRVAQALAGARARVKEPRPLGPGALDVALEAEDAQAVREAAEAALSDDAVDLCV